MVPDIGTFGIGTFGINLPEIEPRLSGHWWILDQTIGIMVRVYTNNVI